RYEITRETKNEDGSWEFEIRFNQATSTGPAGSYFNWLSVRQYENFWYITEIFNDDSVTGQLNSRVKDYLARKYGQHYKILDIQTDLISTSISHSRAEAVFLTKVTHNYGSNNPADWPPQKGRIKYLEENRANLTPQQIQIIQEKISFWNKELQGYIDQPQEANEFLKAAADLDQGSLIKEGTVRLFYEDAMGSYLPIREEDWPAFKTAEELESQGYEEMKQLVNK
ncbi:MAG: copper amine oxidase N-terminal domain-containing protein, partial [Desulfocucumaceae bacterium]